jgi:hypothetical protein
MAIDTWGRIDRTFRPSAPAEIKLECVGCGVTKDVRTLYPRWTPPGGISVPEPMCPQCQATMNKPPNW